MPRPSLTAGNGPDGRRVSLRNIMGLEPETSPQDVIRDLEAAANEFGLTSSTVQEMEPMVGRKSPSFTGRDRTSGAGIIQKQKSSGRELVRDGKSPDGSYRTALHEAKDAQNLFPSKLLSPEPGGSQRTSTEWGKKRDSARVTL